MTVLNGWIALALYLIGLGLAFGFRAVVHLRRNGDTGFRLKAGPVGTASWWGKLLFAAAPRHRAEIDALSARLDLPLHRIGEFTPARERLLLREADGGLAAPAACGYDHFA